MSVFSRSEAQGESANGLCSVICRSTPAVKTYGHEGWKMAELTIDVWPPRRQRGRESERGMVRGDERVDVNAVDFA